MKSDYQSRDLGWKRNLLWCLCFNLNGC